MLILGFSDRFVLYFHTVRHLRIRQLVDRLLRHIWVPRVRLGGSPPLREVRGSGMAPQFRPRSRCWLGKDRFYFLNRERIVEPYQFGLAKSELLWDYHFHYFEGLQDGYLRGVDQERWINRWLANVVPGSRPAWDPYPLSRRIMSWIRWAVTRREGRIPEGFRESLTAQTKHLERTLEHHLMANHLLCNAVALSMAGLYFGGRLGDRWLERGSRILAVELEEQFLGDGAHFELSPTYHALIVEDLLDLFKVGRFVGIDLPENLLATIERGAFWLYRMKQPDGRLPLFNDAAYGMGPEPQDIFDGIAEILPKVSLKSTRGIDHLKDSGYFTYRSRRLFVAGDVGAPGPKYQPGHAHCDMLSFTLCWDTKPIVVDTGTSTYEVGLRRTLERGTSAHNTVQIDDLEQSEIWAGFRMGRRAEMESLSVSDDIVKARARAFPPSWSVVERVWKFDDDVVTIQDSLVRHREENARCVARIHLHPEVPVSGFGDVWTAGGVTIRFHGARSVRRTEYEYAPEFNVRNPAICLEAEFIRDLSTTFIG